MRWHNSIPEKSGRIKSVITMLGERSSNTRNASAPSRANVSEYLSQESTCSTSFRYTGESSTTSTS